LTPIMSESPPALSRVLVWFRRDLRVDDHAALSHALRAARQVWCVFVFDRQILDALPRADRRVEFIRDSLVALDAALARLGGGLIVRHADAAHDVPALARELGVQAVYANHDDDPYALARDAHVRGALADAGIGFRTWKDHVVFERDEVMTAAGTAYGVFTPYKRAWLTRLQPHHLAPHPVEAHAAHLAAPPPALRGVPSLSDIGFAPTNINQLIQPGTAGAQLLLDEFLQRIDRYADTRDFPAVKGPSYLSVHLRFGTVSIRTLARAAHDLMVAGSHGAEIWLSELIWRDFYHQVLHHHPHVMEHAFRREYEAVRWEHGKHANELFAAWCEGRTGYPLVDAAMHQINSSGYMHNRLRMIVASFLTKDLGLDWRWGERYFATHLNDFDLAANNGGWQWAASTGCDAQPYFRIFNPVTQSKKFDPHGRFIRRYLPQLAKLSDAAIHAPWLARPIELAEAGIELGRDYPAPIVDHDSARRRTLERYAVVKAKR
jgi:deoxyribodipyrimidine photo-lyase